MDSEYIHKEYPKTCEDNDFWGQVKRTVGGKPVTQEQIDIIIEAIKNGLELDKKDVLLDIGCGNGALANYLFPEIKEYLGIDFSEYLVDIAKKNFEQLPKYKFLLSDGLDYVQNEKNPKRFNKALCYGAFSYLTEESSEKILRVICEKFVNIDKLYIGNLPDKERAKNFYYDNVDYKSLLKDNNSSIGIWRSKEEFRSLANKSGWKKVVFCNMPENFYSAHYRYDVILSRV